MFSALIHDLKAHELEPAKPCPETKLLAEVNKYLEWVGQSNPYEKIYIRVKSNRSVAAVLALLVIWHVPRIQYVKNVACLTGRKLVDHIDGMSFGVGILTILRQFDDGILLLFIEYLAQFVVSNAEHALGYVKSNMYCEMRMMNDVRRVLYFQRQKGIDDRREHNRTFSLRIH